MNKIGSQLREQLAGLISGMGYELVGCELFKQHGQFLFRIYIDSAKGVTIDDCSKVSYQVSAMLDVEDPIPGRYSLEISSPGIDRPLFELKDYQRFVGSPVKVKLHEPLNERKQYKGSLLRVEGEDIYLLVDVGGQEQEIKLPFSQIEKAHLMTDIKLKAVKNAKRN